MNCLPLIARAVVINAATNPLAEVPCQVYRVSRPSHFPTVVTLRDKDATGPVLFKDWIGVSGSGPFNLGVDFNNTPLNFPNGVFIDGTLVGDLVLYLGPEG